MKGKRILALLLSLAMILTSTVMDASVVFGAEKDSGEKKGATQQSVASAMDVTLTGDGTEASPYQIGTEEELKAFRDLVNTNEASAIASWAELTDDIALTGTWTAISTTSTVTETYSGTFDGNGHTVSNVNMEESSIRRGFFGTINGATIKNLKVSGTITSTRGYVGGVVGFINAGTVENCSFEGSVTTAMSSSSYQAGGIVGGINNNDCTITGCVNRGNITGTYAGGILGYSTKNDVITNCYNEGTIKGASSGRAGGIAGQLSNGSITNCFNIGEVTNADTTYGTVGGIYGFSNATITNCYYTLPEEQKSVGGTATLPADAKVDSMEGMADTLGDAFVDGADHPILSWEGPGVEVKKATVKFDVTPSDAVIKVGKKSVENGQIELKAGSYTYTVSKDGYKTATGSFEVTEAQAEAEETIELDSVALSELESITVEASKTDFETGDELTGLTVTAHYSDETTAEVTDYTTDFDSSEAADSKTVTVSYQGKTATFTVTITQKASVLDPIRGKMDVTLVSGSYGFEDDANNGWLVSNNQKKSSSTAKMTMTAKEAGLFSFKYKVSSEARYDKFKVTVGNSTLVDDESGEVDWKEASSILSVDDVVTFTYTKDSMSDSGQDSAWIKDLALAPAYTVTLTATPANAEIELKDQDGNVITAKDGAYTVTDGTYTYTASAFGYEDKSGTITVNGADVTETVTLTELPKQNITFDITYPDGVISDGTTIVVLSGSSVMEPLTTGGNIYSLPAGDYTYGVSNPFCNTETGTFTVADAAQTITVTLTEKVSVLKPILGKMDVTLVDGSYGFVDDSDNGYLVTNNQGKGSSTAKMTMTALQAGMLSFKYKVGSEQNYDKFTLTHGSTTVVNAVSGTIDWTELSLVVAEGDVLTFSYTKDGSGDRNDDSVWLKDFAMAAVHTVALNVTPENAEVVLKNSDNAEIKGIDNAYSVTDGTYTYSASAFGYEDKTGTITVDGADVTETITLTKLPSRKVSFDVTLPDVASASDTEITVKSGDKVIAKETDGEYDLPAGDYTYTITNPRCDDYAGSFTVSDEDQTIEVTMARKLVLADFIDSDLVTASNDNNYPYKGVYDDNGDYLESTNTGNYQNASITLKFSADAKLGFDYWTNVGTSSYYGVTVEKGSTVLARFNGQNDWTNYSLDASSGDTITIKYSRQYGEAATNSARFKNFEITPVYTVNFTLPEKAIVKLTKDGEEIEGTDTAFKVTDGEYSYTVSKFGYEDKAGTVTVDGENKTVEITDSDLTALDKVKLNFTTDPEDAAVTVTHQLGGTMTAESDGSYDLPKNELYSYKVEKANYITEEGTVELTEAKTIDVKLTYAGEAWDGETKSQPESGTGTAEDPYIVKTGAELAWVADQINSGSGTLCLKLEENINLNDKSWTEIGTTQTRYMGTFDGNGKTISGLNAVKGLFAEVGADAVIKDTIVGGYIHGTMNAGGIADNCYGTIERCMMTGTVENSNNYSTGGIVGRLQSSGKIIECVNKALINNTATIYGSELNTGGIVGYSYGLVDSCYNAGNVQARTDRPTNTRVGGIIGKNYSSSTVRDCYNAGTVTGPEAGSFNFAGWSMGTIDNGYALDGTAPQKTDGVTTKTRAEMLEENFVVLLGADTYNKDSDGINSGYPVLKWQGGSEVDDPDAIDVAEVRSGLKLSARKGEDTFELEADSESKYIIKPDMLDNLVLPEEGDKDTKITWTADPAESVDTENGTVTFPEEGVQEVALTAVISKGRASLDKVFTLRIMSEKAVIAEELDTLADRLTNHGITASEIAYPAEQNLSDVVKRALGDAGFDTEGLEVAFVSAEDADQYIASDGSLTYYTGGDSALSNNYAVLNNCVNVKLTKSGVEKECALKQLMISWDKEYIENLMSEQAAALTWDSFRGENLNSAILDTTGDHSVYTVEGYVTENLKLPAQIGACSVEWKVLEGEEHVTIGQADFDQDMNRYYPCTFEPSTDDDVTVKLQAVLTYNKLNDIDEIEGAADVSARSDYVVILEKNENPGIDKKEVQKAYDEHYAELIKDFVDKDKAVDITSVTEDLQLPTPGDLEKNGMMPDRDNEQVVMTSDNEEVAKIYGYHVYIYRPLPGEDDVTANIAVTLRNRTNGSTVAETTVPVTVKAFTQKEIDDAAAEMKAVATEDIYWAGLAEGTSNTKEEVTENLNSYKEIWKNEDGTYKYVKGKDANFSFIALDELPGYDPMGSQKWWTIRSSNEDVITSENLLVTRPEEENPEVTIDSVMSYVKYANYWEEFGESKNATAETKERYAMFKQFYKVPVSVTVTVKGIHVHQMVHFPAKEDTEDKDGNIEYWMCTSCGKYFADEEGTKELTKSDVIIPKTGGDEPGKDETKPEKVGTTFTVKGNKYKVTSDDAKAPEVSLIKGAKKAKVSVPAQVTWKGIKYKVTAIEKKAFFKNKKVKTVTVGSNILSIGAQAFSKCTKLKKFTAGKNVKKIGAKNFSGSKKLKTLIVKSKKLKRSSIKKALKGSKIKTVKVKVGSKKVNKKFVKKYKKIFVKKVCGRKVIVK